MSGRKMLYFVAVIIVGVVAYFGWKLTARAPMSRPPTPFSNQKVRLSCGESRFDAGHNRNECCV